MAFLEYKTGVSRNFKSEFSSLPWCFYIFSVDLFLSIYNAIMG